MNESTYHINAAHKVQTGEYYAHTFSRDSNVYTPTGKFQFVKDGTKWVVSHVDYGVEGRPVRTYHRLQPTLKAAKDFAEQIVRDLPANVALRREAALRGAMPVAP